jgi:hypothetical protein
MRFTVLVPMLYTLTCGKIPVTTELKYFHEFDVENRAQGDAGHGILAAVLGPGGSIRGATDGRQRS